MKSKFYCVYCKCEVDPANSKIDESYLVLCRPCWARLYAERKVILLPRSKAETAVPANPTESQYVLEIPGGSVQLLAVNDGEAAAKATEELQRRGLSLPGTKLFRYPVAWAGYTTTSTAGESVHCASNAELIEVPLPLALLNRKVKAVRRSTGETWYAYNGILMTEAQAASEARAASEQWGADIDFTVEKA